ERGQLACRVERGQLLEAADRPPVDEDLGHGLPTRPLHEVGAQVVVLAHVDLRERDGARLEESLRTHAVRTARRRGHLHSRHGRKPDRAIRSGKLVDSPRGRRYGPPMPEPSAADAFTRLVDMMARLRGPGGCPWDREQTPESLRPYLLEEA